MVTRADVERAFKEFKKRARPEGYTEGRHTNYVEHENYLAPVKGIWGLASRKRTQSFYTNVANRQLAELGFRLIKNPRVEKPVISEEDALFTEGSAMLVTHLKRERAKGLRQSLLESRRRGGLRCEICDETGRHLDDDVRDALFEAHHRDRPFARAGVRTIGAADMALLCACCHRVLHRIIRLQGWITPVEAKKQMTSRMEGKRV